MWIVWLVVGAVIGAILAVAVPAVFGTVQKMIDDFESHVR